MKKSTIETMIAYLNGTPVDAAALMADLTAELDRVTAKSRANTELRNSITPIVMDALSDTPQTAKEIFAAIADKVPADYTAAKVQYILLHTDGVVKHENVKGANTYTRL